jgi:hypothetical protein
MSAPQLKELIQAMEQGTMRYAMQIMPTHRCMCVQLAPPLSFHLLTAAAACPVRASSRGVVRQLMERAPPDKLPNEIEDLGFVGMITWHQRSQVLPTPVCHLGMYIRM